MESQVLICISLMPMNDEHLLECFSMIQNFSVENSFHIYTPFLRLDYLAY